ncbi:MAG TPA: SIMPL domain-containing protein [Pyrinomonadaceae bacterium]
MRKTFLILLICGLCAARAAAQESGNRSYNQNNARRTPPNVGVTYANGDLVIDAYVLLNAAPDEFVAVFGVAQEAPTAVESNQKVNAQIGQLLDAAAGLGVARGDTFVDFITQNRIYTFSPDADNTIREKLVGFETKKTVALRYKERALLEKLTTAAARVGIFDLIKVDYVVNDMRAVRQRLFEAAVGAVKQKEENYTRVLGMVIKRSVLLQETYDTHYPAELYQTYTAFESGAVDVPYNSGARVIRERKSRTSYLEPLDRSAFDAVLNPAGMEPSVQCTLYMKVLYTVAR